MAINSFPFSIGLEEVEYDFVSNWFCDGGNQGFKFSLRLFIEHKVINRRVKND